MIVRLASIALTLIGLSVPAVAQSSKVSVSELLKDGAAVLNIVPSQEWPYFYLLTTDKRLYMCSLDYDSSYSFFDYRQAPPESVNSRCSEVR